MGGLLTCNGVILSLNKWLIRYYICKVGCFIWAMVSLLIEHDISFQKIHLSRLQEFMKLG